jgi:hypothetical protein
MKVRQILGGNIEESLVYKFILKFVLTKIDNIRSLSAFRRVHNNILSHSSKERSTGGIIKNAASKQSRKRTRPRRTCLSRRRWGGAIALVFGLVSRGVSAPAAARDDAQKASTQRAGARGLCSGILLFRRGIPGGVCVKARAPGAAHRASNRQPHDADAATRSDTGCCRASRCVAWRVGPQRGRVRKRQRGRSGARCASVEVSLY